MAKKDSAPAAELVVESVVEPAVAQVTQPEPVVAEIAPEPTVAETPVQRLNIQEACSRISDGNAKLFLLLYAFQREEENAGRTVDSLDNYRARFNAMQSRPAIR